MRKLSYYVFCDIVDFTQIPSNDRQLAAIKQLHNVVKLATIDVKKKFFIPTGDGICIVIEPGNRYDEHFEIARVLKMSTSDSGWLDNEDNFLLRIGVGQGVDLLFSDINGQRNCAGRGINETARAMQSARPGAVVATKQAKDHVDANGAYASLGAFKEFQKDIKGTTWTFFEYESILWKPNL